MHSLPGGVHVISEPKKGVRILVADDNPAVRRYLRGILEQQEGWRVCDEARNGPEVIEHFKEVHPDLVLLDFQMPEINGLEVARTLAKLSPETPILMVTLYLSRQLAEEARKVGIRGTCAKTEISSVVDAVNALLRDETYFPGFNDKKLNDASA
jgi:two-component system, NarL family, invasion response regulator UvrY